MLLRKAKWAAEVPQAELTAQEEIPRNVQVPHKPEVLVDRLDARLAMLGGVPEFEVLAIELDGPRGWLQSTRDDLQQGRLPSAIVAHQTEDLTSIQRERDTVERLDGSEPLDEVPDLQGPARQQVRHS